MDASRRSRVKRIWTGPMFIYHEEYKFTVRQRNWELHQAGYFSCCETDPGVPGPPCNPDWQGEPFPKSDPAKDEKYYVAHRSVFQRLKDLIAAYFNWMGDEFAAGTPHQRVWFVGSFLVGFYVSYHLTWAALNN